MSYYGSDEWAVIVSGTDDKLKPIQLSGWEECEWSDFSVLKDESDNQIKWFDDEEQAIEFIFDNFDKSLISQDLVLARKSPSGYYFG